MNAATASPPSSATGGKKREHDQLDEGQDGAGGGAGGSSSSNFRNVSACNRCRQRKNRCDQKLPACTACEKASVKCVGFDPVSKREIPRSYVYYLESRIVYLERLLQAGNIPFSPPDDFTISIRPHSVPFPPHGGGSDHASPPATKHGADAPAVGGALDPALKEHDDRLNQLVSNIGMVSVRGASDARYLGSTSGISFARVVFAAVRSSVANTPSPSERSERGGVNPSVKQAPGSAVSGGTSMRDSFFGLHTKPTIKPAPFPEKELALKLVYLYFENANPQIPILHRGEFMALLDRVYSLEVKRRTPRELYMLNIVFAIGSGIILESSDEDSDSGASDAAKDQRSRKKARLSNHQHQPEEYHSSAIMHLESFLGSSPAAEGVGGGLEELQAVLLLAGLALLRPVAPGLWYIIGVAVRLGVDLGLHFEDNDGHVKTESDSPMTSTGHREWSRDLRRRLWWCVYSFDRLVSTCVGRPFGITDQVVTTEFPTILDDKYISQSGFSNDPAAYDAPSYKHASHHYFRLRLLQSEILQVLQHRQAQQARASGANLGNQYMHTMLPSPFLHSFSSFREWRMDVDRRLWQWKESQPRSEQLGVKFATDFLELNYWQAVIMLYRQSLSVPAPLAGEISSSTGADVQSPNPVSYEDREDEQMVFLKVAEAGQKVLKLYRQLHRLKLVNYTFLATHHLFMSGISFLYAIWHSPYVRSQLTLDDVDLTCLAATSVLGDLIEKCPPAEACRDAFRRMSKATISMVMTTTEFGKASTLNSRASVSSSSGYFESGSTSPVQSRPRQRPRPKFDMNMRDLFGESEMPARPFGAIPSRQPAQPRHQVNSTQARPPLQQTSQYMGISPPGPNSLPYLPTSPQPQLTPTQQPQHPITYNVSNQQPYQPLADTNSANFPDTSFGNLDFLDSFPVTDPNSMDWSTGSFGGQELDLGFGTGGTAFCGETWDDGSGNFDLFNGFFFGNNGE